MATRQEFYGSVYDMAREKGANHVQASLAAAQATHETAGGTRVKGNNYFGIKGASRTGKSQTFATKEYAGQKITDKFAAYSGLSESLDHYMSLMERAFPSAWNASTMPEATAALQNGRFGEYGTHRDAKGNWIYGGLIEKTYDRYGSPKDTWDESLAGNPSTLGGLNMLSGATLGRIGEARRSTMTDQYGNRVTVPTASPRPTPTFREDAKRAATEDQKASVANTFANTVSQISDLYGVSPAVAAEQLVPGIGASLPQNVTAEQAGQAFANISAGVASAQKTKADLATVGSGLISTKGKEYAQSAIIADKISTTAQELGVPYSVVAEQMVPGISASLQPNASLRDIASTVSGLAGQVATVSKTTPDEAASKITGGAYQAPFGATGSAVGAGNKTASASASANVPQAQAASLPSRGRVNEYAPNAGYRAPSASVGRVNSYAPMAGVAAVPTARPSYTPPELAYAAPETTSQYQPGPFSFTRQTTPQPTVPQENIGPYGVNPDLPRDIDGRMQSQSQYDARRTGLPTPTARPSDYNVDTTTPVDAVTQSAPSYGRVNAYAPNANRSMVDAQSLRDQYNAAQAQPAQQQVNSAATTGRVGAFAPTADVASGGGGGGGWGDPVEAVGTAVASRNNAQASGSSTYAPEARSLSPSEMAAGYANGLPQSAAVSRAVVGDKPATVSEGLFGNTQQAQQTAPNSGMSMADQYASYGIGHNSAYVAPIDRPGSGLTTNETPDDTTVQQPQVTQAAPQVTSPAPATPQAPMAPTGPSASFTPQVGQQYDETDLGQSRTPGSVVNSDMVAGGARAYSLGNPAPGYSPFPSIFSPIGRLMTPFVGGFGQPGGLAGGLFGAVAGALSGLNANDIGGTGIPTFDKVMGYNKAQSFANANQTAMAIGKDSRGKLGWGNAGPLSAGAAGAGWMSNNPERSYGGYGSGYDPTPT